MSFAHEFFDPMIYRGIAPTRSESLSGEERGAPRIIIPAQPSGPREHQLFGQKLRIYQIRRGRHESSMISNQTNSNKHKDPPSSNRQANPDIQDIITGIVKLLNGKVNVAVNSAKPHRPVQSTRINNRGPPRISDLPPMPTEFENINLPPPPPVIPEQPAMYDKPPKLNVPSINQLPPNLPLSPFGVPLPEGMFPPNMRPFNRPPPPLPPGLRPPPGKFNTPNWPNSILSLKIPHSSLERNY